MRPTGVPTQRAGPRKRRRARAAWANSPAVLAEVGAWYDAATLDQEKAAARRVNKTAMDHVLYAPLGWYVRHYAWRKNVTGVVKAPFPVFWDVSKT